MIIAPAMNGIAPGQRAHARDMTWMEQIAGSGSDFFRGGPRWDTVEPTLGGARDWRDWDLIFDRAEALGLQVLFTVAGRDNNNNAYAAEYAAYALAAAQRYHGRVLGWELGNEPNHVIWSGAPTAAGYVELLKRAYSAIKGAFPAEIVITAGLGGASNDAGDGDSADYLTAMYAAGARGYFDAVGYHPYSTGTIEDSVATQKGGGWRLMRSRQTMKDHGDKGRRIWITEVGNPTGGTGYHVSEAEQASIVAANAHWFGARSWIGPVAWFDLIDDPNPVPGNHGDFCGLLRKDGSEKPAMHVFRAINAAA